MFEPGDWEQEWCRVGCYKDGRHCRVLERAAVLGAVGWIQAGKIQYFLLHYTIS
jgi:hypothetical protein